MTLVRLQGVLLNIMFQSVPYFTLQNDCNVQFYVFNPFCVIYSIGHHRNKRHTLQGGTGQIVAFLDQPKDVELHITRQSL